ncbi:MAG: putative lipoprotein [Labilithrix sp.]|nr:putative lipoprotein [Labilithrix sp.]
MKARLTSAVVVLALGLSAPATARAADPDPDPWFGKDKALHFGVSAGIASVSYAAAATIFDARGHALLAAGGVTLAVGAGKELFDLAGYGDPSWKDFAADVAGMIVGLAVAWSVDLLVRGADDQHPLFVTPHVRAPSAQSTSGPAPRLVMQGLVFSF